MGQVVAECGELHSEKKKKNCILKKKKTVVPVNKKKFFFLVEKNLNLSSRRAVFMLFIGHPYHILLITYDKTTTNMDSWWSLLYNHVQVTKFLPSFPHLLLLASSAAFCIGSSRGDAMSATKIFYLVLFRNRNDPVLVQSWKDYNPGLWVHFHKVKLLFSQASPLDNDRTSL